jgi:indole-3-glycerol phosphate synthase
LSNVLDEILAHKRQEVEQSRAARPAAELQALAGYNLPRRNFYGTVAIPRRGRPNLIAEIKRASPSAGLICPDFDPVRIARLYAAGGASALSVLTDERFFGGHLDFIGQIKAAVGLPVLRKDFLVDPYQLYESRAFEADAVLLIAEALELEPLAELLTLAGALGLAVLLEVHSRERLVDVLPLISARRQNDVLLGINNRDLSTQTVDLGTTERLAELVPPGTPIVAESGIRTPQDVIRLHAAGARALLIGETLMRSADPEATIQQFFR